MALNIWIYWECFYWTGKGISPLRDILEKVPIGKPLLNNKSLLEVKPISEGFTNKLELHIHKTIT